jgi:hypothetical protein
MITEIQLFESPDPISLDFCLWGWMKSEVYKRKVGTRYGLLDRILGAASCIKKHEDQLRRTTRYLRTRVAAYIEVDGGIFEHLLRTVTNMSLKH